MRRSRNSVARASASWSTRSPAMLTVPDVGRSITPSRLSSVLLPQPEGPTIATSSDCLLPQRAGDRQRRAAPRRIDAGEDAADDQKPERGPRRARLEEKEVD